jgi:aminopeptidase N
VADVGEAFDNRDIYTKGTWLLHTLRRYVGDEVFWRGTRRLLYDTAEPWDLNYPIQAGYRTTEDFTRIMSEEAGEDLGWLIEAILYQADMPDLVVERGDGVATLEWRAAGGLAFPMPVTVAIDDDRTTLAMQAGSGTVPVPAGARFVVDPDSLLLRRLPLIGDCDEQTDEQIQRNLKRYTEMARTYGWRRPQQ